MIDMKECFVVDDAVVVRFGKSREELAAMTLGQFFEMAFAQGYDVQVGAFAEAAGGRGRLFVKMADPQQAAKA